MPRTPKQDDVLSAARKSQEIMIDAIRTWVETVRTATPRLSSMYAPLAERLPRVPSVYAPIAGKLPKPHEAVASAYDLAERLLASQRKFAEDLVKVTKPLMPGFSQAAAPQDHPDAAPRGHNEPAPRETAAETVPQETAAAEAPKPAAAESAPKTSPARRTPKTTTASRAPKSAPAKRAPRSTDAG